MMAASEALEFEKAIEYRELLNSVKNGGSETEDYRFQWGRQRCHGSCTPGRRCSCTGRFLFVAED